MEEGKTLAGPTARNFIVSSVISIAHRISHGTNVVVVNNQSANSKKISLPFDWMLATTTF